MAYSKAELKRYVDKASAFIQAILSTKFVRFLLIWTLL
jgi:hypothetical protein